MCDHMVLFTGRSLTTTDLHYIPGDFFKPFRLQYLFLVSTDTRNLQTLDRSKDSCLG